MSSDSDDDVPLGARVVKKEPTEAASPSRRHTFPQSITPSYSIRVMCCKFLCCSGVRQAHCAWLWVPVCLNKSLCMQRSGSQRARAKLHQLPRSRCVGPWKTVPLPPLAMLTPINSAFQQAEPEEEVKPTKAATAKGKEKGAAAAGNGPAQSAAHASIKGKVKAEAGKEQNQKKARKWLWPWQKRDTPPEVRLAQLAL